MSNSPSINESQDSDGPHRLFDLPRPVKPRKVLSSFPKNSMADILRAADKDHDSDLETEGNSNLSETNKFRQTSSILFNSINQPTKETQNQSVNFLNSIPNKAIGKKGNPPRSSVKINYFEEIDVFEENTTPAKSNSSAKGRTRQQVSRIKAVLPQRKSTITRKLSRNGGKPQKNSSFGDEIGGSTVLEERINKEPMMYTHKFLAFPKVVKRQADKGDGDSGDISAEKSVENQEADNLGDYVPADGNGTQVASNNESSGAQSFGKVASVPGTIDNSKGATASQKKAVNEKSIFIDDSDDTDNLFGPVVKKDTPSKEIPRKRAELKAFSSKVVKQETFAAAKIPGDSSCLKDSTEEFSPGKFCYEPSIPTKSDGSLLEIRVETSSKNQVNLAGLNLALDDQTNISNNDHEVDSMDMSVDQEVNNLETGVRSSILSPSPNLSTTAAPLNIEPTVISAPTHSQESSTASVASALPESNASSFKVESLKLGTGASQGSFKLQASASSKGPNFTGTCSGSPASPSTTSSPEGTQVAPRRVMRQRLMRETVSRPLKEAQQLAAPVSDSESNSEENVFHEVLPQERNNSESEVRSSQGSQNRQSVTDESMTDLSSCRNSITKDAEQLPSDEEAARPDGRRLLQTSYKRPNRGTRDDSESEDRLEEPPKKRRRKILASRGCSHDYSEHETSLCCHHGHHPAAYGYPYMLPPWMYGGHAGGPVVVRDAAGNLYLKIQDAVPQKDLVPMVEGQVPMVGLESVFGSGGREEMRLGNPVWTSTPVRGPREASRDTAGPLSPKEEEVLGKPSNKGNEEEAHERSGASLSQEEESDDKEESEDCEDSESEEEDTGGQQPGWAAQHARGLALFLGVAVLTSLFR